MLDAAELRYRDGKTGNPVAATKSNAVEGALVTIFSSESDATSSSDAPGDDRVLTLLLLLLYCLT